MDKNKLALLTESKIFYGDIKNTVDEFAKLNPKNIIAIFNDLDYYSATADFLKQINKLEDFLAPRVYFYFDDLFTFHHYLNEFNGERKAIEEFNLQNENIKIGSSVDHIGDFKFPLAKNLLLMLHNFKHKDYFKFIGFDDENSSSIGDRKLSGKIF